MKTKTQVLDQIRHYIFSEEDWKSVKGFCNKHYGKGFYKSFRGNLRCSYTDFLKWVDYGYGVGDIVKCGRTLGIVHLHLGDRIKLSAFLNNLDELITEIPDSLIMNESDISSASSDEICKMQYILFQNKLEIDFKTGKMSKISRHIPGKMYHFMLGEEKCHGILKSTLNDQACFFFALKSKNLVEDEIIVPVADVVAAVSNEEENNIKDLLLKKHGAVWSVLNKCFQYYGIRCIIGGQYYYITDKFTITYCKDTHSSLHTMRYEMGNYFRDFDEAVAFLKEIQALRAKMSKRGDHH